MRSTNGANVRRCSCIPIRNYQFLVLSFCVNSASMFSAFDWTPRFDFIFCVTLSTYIFHCSFRAWTSFWVSIGSSSVSQKCSPPSCMQKHNLSDFFFKLMKIVVLILFPVSAIYVYMLLCITVLQRQFSMSYKFLVSLLYFLFLSFWLAPATTYQRASVSMEYSFYKFRNRDINIILVSPANSTLGGLLQYS